MNTAIPWDSYLNAVLDFFRANAVGIFVVLLLLFCIERIITYFVNHYLPDERKRLFVLKWTRYSAFLLAGLWLLIIYNNYARKDTPVYLFVVGIVLATVAISMRELFTNVTGWMIINSSRGFREGDRITIGDTSGDVIDIGILRTTLSEIGGWVDADQSTGRLVSLPNSMIITSSVYNYTEAYDFIWNELPVLITFESDWRLAETIMHEIAMQDFEPKRDQIQERLKRVRRKYLLRYNIITPYVYVSIVDSGIRLTLRSLVRARLRRGIQDTLSRKILERFSLEGSIDFAYPTMRLYRRGEEQTGLCATIGKESEGHESPNR